MTHAELARQLIETDPVRRAFVLAENSHLIDGEIGKAFQQICYEIWTTEPQKVSVIAEILREIADSSGVAEIRAYLEWTKAIENLVGGRLEKCIDWLSKSEAGFQNLGKPHAAATTQIS